MPPKTIPPVASKSAEELRIIFKPFDIKTNHEKYTDNYPEGLLKKSSVLIPLVFKGGEYYVILTLRSKHLSQHAGFVALPGGLTDEKDIDEIQTALREAEEEIGLSPLNVNVIGVFSPVIVVPNILVYPVIGLVKSCFKPVVNEKEVSFVFELPLKRFLSPERQKRTDYRSPINSTYHSVHFIDTVDGREVETWGVTASLCIMTALGLYQTDHTFCFYDDFEIHKGNIFDPSATQDIIQRMQKLKLSKV